MKNLLLPFFLGVLWGPSFLLIKLAGQGLDPLTVAALRIGIAMPFLLAFALIRGVQLPPFGKIWLHIAGTGFFSQSLPFVLFCYAELYVSSVLASIVNGTVPVIVALLAFLFLKEEIFSIEKLIGILIGIVGFTFILLPSCIRGGSISGDTVGIISLIIAACSYSIGMIYARRHLKSVTSIAIPTAQFICSTLYMLPLAFLFGTSFDHGMPSTESLLAVTVLALYGTALAFIVYYHILEKQGAVALGMALYTLPVFGTIFGRIFLNEMVSWNTYVAAGFILISVMIVNGTLGLNKLFAKQ